MAEIISKVFIYGLKSHFPSERLCSETAMSLLKVTCTKIIPAMERSEMRLWFPQSASFHLFLYREIIWSSQKSSGISMALVAAALYISARIPFLPNALSEFLCKMAFLISVTEDDKSFTNYTDC